jgi:hypothetical protein
MNVNKPFEPPASAVGLITESQFSSVELYGFEVDMNGTVLVPEFHPRRVPTDALPAVLSFTSEFLAAIAGAA